MANEYTINQPDFIQQFGYPQLPSEQQLQKTQQARQESLIAQSRQKRLQQQQQEAQALKADAGGFGKQDEFAHWGSALAGLGNVAAGHQKSQQNKLQQQGNEQMLAKSQAQVEQAQAAKGQRAEQFQLAQAMRAEQARQEQAAAMQSRHEDNLQLKRATAAQKLRPEYQEPTRRFMKDGTPVEAAFDSRSGKYLTPDGKAIPASEMMQHGDVKLTPKERDSLAGAPALMDRTVQYRSLPDESWQTLAQPNGLPTEVVNKFLSGTSDTGIAEWIDKNKKIDKYSRGLASKVDWDLVDQQRQFINDFKLTYVMPYRELATSGVLSDQDVKEFNSAINVQMGQNWKNMKAGVMRLADLASQKLQTDYKNKTRNGTAETYDMYDQTLGKYFGEGGSLTDEAKAKQTEEQAKAALAEELPQAPEQKSEQRQVDHAAKEQQAAMMELMNDPSTPPELRAQIEKDLAKVKGGF